MNKTISNILFKIPALRRYAEKQWLDMKREVYTQMQRGYAAAASTRFTMDWVTGADNINKDIKHGLVPVRRRARELWKNNDYVRGLRLRNHANVVGPEGFTFQSKAKLADGSEDEVANRIIEEHWDLWQQPEYCTMAGELSFLEVMWLWSDQFARDGEILLRTVSNAPNKYGFSLELLETDLLDESYNERLKNGNVVIQGIEFMEFQKPVAYWFRRNELEDEYNSSVFLSARSSIKRLRVEADEIIFCIDPEHSNQKRGMSHLAQSMMTFHNQQGYDEAALFNARLGASKNIFIKQSIEGGGNTGYGTATPGVEIESVSYGDIEYLRPGEDIASWSPTYPTDQYAPFTKAILRRMATGLGLAYANWTGDLEAVNFSSMRSGLQDERDVWRMKQARLRNGVLNKVNKRWLKSALICGALKEGKTVLNFYEFERLWKPVFMGRGWDWVDPEADVAASVAAMDANLTTLHDELGKKGKDYNEVIAMRKRELEDQRDLMLLKAEIMGIEAGMKAGANGDGAAEGESGSYAATEKKKLKLAG